MNRLWSPLLCLVLLGVAGCATSPSPSGTRSPGPSATPLSSTIATSSPGPTVQPTLGPLPTALLAAEPKAALTPGALNPAVTQGTIKQTICSAKWVAAARPSPTKLASQLQASLTAYGYTGQAAGNYVEDQLISINLGGSPTNPANLWPEPFRLIAQPSGQNSLNGFPVDFGMRTKTAYESWLNQMVCAGSLPLAKAQQRLTANWIASWITDGRPGN